MNNETQHRNSQENVVYAKAQSGLKYAFCHLFCIQLPSTNLTGMYSPKVRLSSSLPVLRDDAVSGLSFKPIWCKYFRRFHVNPVCLLAS